MPDAVPLVPTTTLPTPRVAGVTLNCPAAVAPVPDSGIVEVGFEASDVMVTSPLTAPADFGENDTVNVALWPALRVIGATIPLKLKPVPVIVTFETVMLALPAFVTFSDRDCLPPTVTVPNDKLPFPRDRLPICEPEPPPLLNP